MHKRQNVKNVSRVAKFISNRHFGIGSDGLILILKRDIADFKMEIFNFDGSQAKMCGNGIRCVGKYVYDKGLTRKEQITIETLAGIKTLKLNVKQGKVVSVEVDMGKPILEASKIPVISDEYPVKRLKIDAYNKEVEFTCVSMGNPHAVTIVNNETELLFKPIDFFANSLISMSLSLSNFWLEFSDRRWVKCLRLHSVISFALGNS